MTVATIVETGYITNFQNRRIIVYQPKLAAQGIAKGIESYLRQEIAEGNLPTSL